jgi:hypothetical protein
MSERHTAQFWIDRLELEPHPEGGYFKEVYRADEKIAQDALPDRYSGSREFSTSIYYLLESHDISKFHVLQTDELWHFYTGAIITLHILNEKSGYSRIRLGNKPDKSTQLQAAIKRNSYFGVSIDQADGFALVGCTMAPAFHFEDFELAERTVLLEKFPDQKDIITKLTTR